MQPPAILPATWPLDWTIVFAAAAIISFDAVRSGSARAASLALAAPLSLTLYGLVGQASLLATTQGALSSGITGAVILAVLFVVSYLFVRRMLGLWSGEESGVLTAVLSGAACTVVLVMLWLQVPLLDSFWHFGEQVRMVFAEQYRFWWYLGAFAVLAYTRS